MERVQEWLNGARSYDTGVQLYLELGKDPLLKLLFQEDYSDYKQEKLVSVMKSLVTGGQPITKPLPAAPVSPAVTNQEVKKLEEKVTKLSDEVQVLEDEIYDLRDTNEDLEETNTDLRSENEKLQQLTKEVRKGWPAVMDDALKAFHAKWLAIFSEKKNLQSRLFDIAKAGETDPVKKNEAGAMAHRILDLRDQCRQMYSDRDYYLQHAKFPEEKQLIDLPTDPKLYPKRCESFKRYIREYNQQLRKTPNHKNAGNWKRLIENYQWGVAKLEELMGGSNAI